MQFDSEPDTSRVCLPPSGNDQQQDAATLTHVSLCVHVY